MRNKPQLKKSYENVTTQPISFDFNGTLPNYIRIESDSDTPIVFNSIQLEYSCNFVDNLKTIHVETYPLSGGTAEIVGVEGSYSTKAAGTNAHIIATPSTGYNFAGWYNGTELYSSDLDTYVSLNTDIILTATFNEDWDKKHGVIPVVDGSYVTYGLYPQTHVNDASLISELDKLTNPDERGYYFYENEYYTKVTAKPYASGFTFDDGTTIVSGTEYWFKLEAIKWKILTNADGQYFLTSDKLLDAQRYGENYSETKSKTDYKGQTADVYSNNYKYSDLRTYLNTTFYNKAFFLADTNIKITAVDNSAVSTGRAVNPYACEETQDKVFALSYQEVNNRFTDAVARKCLTTDYARADGTYQLSNYGYYYLRSPGTNNSFCAYEVDYNGQVGSNGISKSFNGLRPALWLNI